MSKPWLFPVYCLPLFQPQYFRNTAHMSQGQGQAGGTLLLNSAVIVHVLKCEICEISAE